MVIVMRRLIWLFLSRHAHLRSRLLYNWLCRADRYYIRHSRVGLCVCFAETRPWWLSRSLKVSDVIPEFSRDGLTSLFPSREWNDSDYSARPTVYVDELRDSYWWPITDRYVRMRVLRHLQDVYRIYYELC
jgi:hypothetical protein